MIEKSKDGRTRVLSLSYGKDSMATIRACELLHYPIDRIITVDVWATDELPADIPQMWEWKKNADKIIFETFGIHVEHFHATTKNGEKLTYEKMFYRQYKKHRKQNEINHEIYGFPMRKGAWCNSNLKVDVIKKNIPKNAIQHIGIAADEKERIKRHKNKENIVMPLVDIGWEEDLCGIEAACLSLLSPVYTHGNRDGCWFCHNQSIGQLRNLRKKYKKLWEILCQWDADSPVTFKSDGHTVRDFEERFCAEENNELPNKKFKWEFLEFPRQLYFEVQK